MALLKCTTNDRPDGFQTSFLTRISDHNFPDGNYLFGLVIQQNKKTRPEADLSTVYCVENSQLVRA